MTTEFHLPNFKETLQKEKFYGDSKQFNEDKLSCLLLDYWHKTKEKQSLSPVQKTEKKNDLKLQNSEGLNLNNDQPDKLSTFLNEYVNNR